jgi:predicted SAM-dependent methyltransferase
MKLLNLGCGAIFHPGWVNLDASPLSPGVTRHDLRRGLPFEGDTFDAAYSSHVLEHLGRRDGARLIGDCYRVVRPGGFIRLAVPDLETIARLYLASLDGALAGDAEAEMRYDWMMLELYDQVVRTRSGGEMAAYLAQKQDERQVSFVSSRIGLEGADAAKELAPGFCGVTALMRRGCRVAARLRTIAAGAFVFLAMGSEGRAALHEGEFRRGGEIHQWMYDRFSLCRLLKDSGFEVVRICRAGESGIPDFAESGLEIVRGRERKPDSLYMEACKPTMKLL